MAPEKSNHVQHLTKNCTWATIKAIKNAISTNCFEYTRLFIKKKFKKNKVGFLYQNHKHIQSECHLVFGLEGDKRELG